MYRHASLLQGGCCSSSHKSTFQARRQGRNKALFLKDSPPQGPFPTPHQPQWVTGTALAARETGKWHILNARYSLLSKTKDLLEKGKVYPSALRHLRGYATPPRPWEEAPGGFPCTSCLPIGKAAPRAAPLVTAASLGQESRRLPGNAATLPSGCHGQRALLRVRHVWHQPFATSRPLPLGLRHCGCPVLAERYTIEYSFSVLGPGPDGFQNRPPSAALPPACLWACAAPAA